MALSPVDQDGQLITEASARATLQTAAELLRSLGPQTIPLAGMLDGAQSQVQVFRAQFEQTYRGMREICFRRTTGFSVTSTAIRHSQKRSTAKFELVFASGSLRLTFHDPRALLVVVNALNQLSDADDPDLTQGTIMTRVFNRQHAQGSPDPAEPFSIPAVLFPTAGEF
jgi:hypothetical protein